MKITDDVDNRNTLTISPQNSLFADSALLLTSPRGTSNAYKCVPLKHRTIVEVHTEYVFTTPFPAQFHLGNVCWDSQVLSERQWETVHRTQRLFCQRRPDNDRKP